MDCKKINAKLLLTMTILAALWIVPPVHAQPWLVRGTVTDTATGQPLPAATVQLAGTYRGTIANDEGEYSLKVQQLPATLKVSYIGYVSQERVLTAPAERSDFALMPVPFLFDPIVVTAEISAEGIMRQVIRRKQEWRPSLASYQAQAYARRVLENEEGIVSIGEMASEIYWERERGLREVVKSRRVTQNLEAQEEYISAFAGFANFYDDDIPFIGHTLIGPTHPDALKHYRFGLIGQRYLDDKVVFDISVEPKEQIAGRFCRSRLSIGRGFRLARSRAGTQPSDHDLSRSPARDRAHGFCLPTTVPRLCRRSVAAGRLPGLYGSKNQHGRAALSRDQVQRDNAAERLPSQCRYARFALRQRGSAAGRFAGRGPRQFLCPADRQGAPVGAGTSRLCHHRQHYAVRKGLPADGVSRPFVDEGTRGKRRRSGRNGPRKRRKCGWSRRAGDQSI